MPTKIKLHDFLEVEYTGKFPDGAVFDTTDKDVAEKNNIFSPQMNYQPVTICVGEKQLIPGLDDALLNKEIGKTYNINLKPEEAFGKKDIKKIRLVPLAEFRKQNIQPQPGLQIDMDGQVGRVIRASGGRILVNFNHPFSGREVIYEIKINKKITDQATQLKSYLELSFNIPDIEAEVKEDKATITLPMDLPEQIQQELTKKLQEITKVKEITFQTKKPSQKQSTPNQ
ncbi:peptidylprolyl isomerase [Candidatus Woesearchaeota archaeon]|nr:peptidylprolyl isomerase [Candidatus Woesearchaeota archaeon]